MTAPRFRADQSACPQLSIPPRWTTVQRWGQVRSALSDHIFIYLEMEVNGGYLVHPVLSPNKSREGERLAGEGWPHSNKIGLSTLHHWENCHMQWAQSNLGHSCGRENAMSRTQSQPWNQMEAFSHCSCYTSHTWTIWSVLLSTVGGPNLVKRLQCGTSRCSRLTPDILGWLQCLVNRIWPKSGAILVVHSHS